MCGNEETRRGECRTGYLLWGSCVHACLRAYACLLVTRECERADVPPPVAEGAKCCILCIILRSLGGLRGNCCILCNISGPSRRDAVGMLQFWQHFSRFGGYARENVALFTTFRLGRTAAARI